jgi:hypothetical protein
MRFSPFKASPATGAFSNRWAEADALKLAHIASQKLVKLHITTSDFG